MEVNKVENIEKRNKNIEEKLPRNFEELYIYSQFQKTHARNKNDLYYAVLESLQIGVSILDSKDELKEEVENYFSGITSNDLDRLPKLLKLDSQVCRRVILDLGLLNPGF
jgi:hypothetical protein